MSQSTSSRELAEKIAEVVLGIDGVTGLDDGGYGRVATYGRGPRIAGVKFSDERVLVRVSVTAAQPLAEVNGRIRKAVSGLTESPVDIEFGDLTLDKDL